MELDNLQIKISADTQQAIDALNKLRNALNGIDKQSKSNAFDTLAMKINHFAAACRSSIPDVERLGNAIEKIASLKQGALMKTAKQVTGLGFNDTAIKDGTQNVNPNTAAYEDIKATNEYAKSAEKAAEATGFLAKMFALKNKFLESQTVKTKKDGQAVGGLGDKVKKATKSVNLFNNSIMRVLKYRMIRSAIKAIGDAYKEGLGNLYQYSKTLETIDTSGNVSQTLDQLTSTLLQLKNTLGVTFGYLAITLQPLITIMSDGLMKLAESINILLSDALGNTTFYKAKYNLKDYMEIAEKTRKANKGLLQSFDELHNITTGNDNSIDPADMFEQVEITKELKDAAAGTIVADVAKVGAAIAAYEGLKAIVKGVIGMFSKKNDALDTQTQKTGVETAAVGALATAFGLAVIAGGKLKDKLDELGAKWNPLPDIVPDPVLVGLANASEAIDGVKDSLGKLVPQWKPLISIVPTAVVTAFETLTKKVDGLKDSRVNLGKKWSPLTNIVPNGLANAIDTVTTSVEKLTSAIKKLFDVKAPETSTSTQKTLNPYANMNPLAAANAYKKWNEETVTTPSAVTSEQNLIKNPNEVREYLNSQKSGIDKVFDSLQKVFEGLLGSSFLPIPSLVPGFASGGFPSAGSLFWAGETNTPELLGTVNGRTAVAGGAEITGIREAIYEVGAQMLNAIANESVTIEGDMSKFLRVLKKSQYNEGLRLGTV